MSGTCPSNARTHAQACKVKGRKSARWIEPKTAFDTNLYIIPTGGGGMDIYRIRSLQIKVAQQKQKDPHSLQLLHL